MSLFRGNVHATSLIDQFQQLTYPVLLHCQFSSVRVTKLGNVVICCLFFQVVVRHLPPTMTLESFLEQVSPLPPVDYMYFVKADSSLGLLSFSRAYLNFVNVDDLIIFTEKFDNYVFVDAKGNLEYT